MIHYWNGVDYSNFGTADGYTDSDSDGETDSNDAINFIETLKALGYDVPETTLNGLYGNYYTGAGYDCGNEDSHEKHDFVYTGGSSVTEADLINADWSGLEIGDLIFVDNDSDDIWDNAAVYLGAHGGYTHAALVSSDYHDETLVLDLDDSTSVFNHDIVHGSSAVRKPVFFSEPAD
jgi:hypothetical protein